MRILDRYIGTRFLGGFLLLLCILFSLFTFVELLTQLDNVGKRNFHVQDAFFFVALNTPRRIYDLIPMSALLGSIIALGVLADRGELLAMQAAGVSVRRICGTVLVTGALLIPAVVALGEFVAPPLEQSARTLCLRALSDPGVLPTKQGFWARRGNACIHVARSFGGEAAADVDIFERDDQWRITRVVHASRATISPNRRWLLQDVTERTIADEDIKTQGLPSLELDSFLSPAQVAVLQLPPDTMSARDLYHYIRALRERGQNASTYALALWQKITMPVATGTMILLSLTFVFGPPRERTPGFRIMMGCMVGVAFFLANQVMGRLGLVLEFHPAVATMTPIAAILAVAVWLLRRIA
jgi:lipopolysaccharide export system permease protein